MTIPASDRRKEYAGNGVTTVYAGPRAFSASHIAVYLVEDATGDATLVPTDDYALSGVNANGATSVTMETAPASGYTLLILRTVPYTQETDITNQGAFLPEVIEDMADAQEQQIQQLADRLDRALHFGDTTIINNFDTELPEPQALYSLRWNADADALENYLPEADDASYVHIAGAETITGRKTFSGGVKLADAFRAGGEENDLDLHMQVYTDMGFNVTAGVGDDPDWNFHAQLNSAYTWSIAGSEIGRFSLAYFHLARKTLMGQAVQQAVGSLSITAGEVALNCNTANYFTLDLSANVTAWDITFPSLTYAQTIWIKIRQHASAAKTVVWPAEFQWEGGEAPTVSSDLSAVDVLCLTTTDGATFQATLAKGWAA